MCESIPDVPSSEFPLAVKFLHTVNIFPIVIFLQLVTFGFTLTFKSMSVAEPPSIASCDTVGFSTTFEALLLASNFATHIPVNSPNPPFPVSVNAGCTTHVPGVGIVFVISVVSPIGLFVFPCKNLTSMVYAVPPFVGTLYAYLGIHTQ